MRRHMTPDQIKLKTKAGITVSIVQGQGTYSTDGTVEVGAWDAAGRWVYLGEHDTVEGYVDVPALIEILQRVERMG